MKNLKAIIEELKAKGFSAEEILRILETSTDGDPFSERRVKEALTQLGMPAYMKGFEYWSYVLSNFGREEKSMSEIYTDVAAHFNVKVCTVSKNLHDALEETYTRGDIRKLEKFFGSATCFYQHNGSISNKNFLTLMRTYLNQAWKTSKGDGICHLLNNYI